LTGAAAVGRDSQKEVATSLKSDVATSFVLRINC